MTTSPRRWVPLLILATGITACGGGTSSTTDEGSSETTTTTEAAGSTTSTEAEPSTTTEPPTTTEPSTSTEPEASSPIDVSGDAVIIDWAALPSTPFFALAGGTGDPFYHVHTDGEADGFFLSFELYTEWGQGWTGESGTFDISCSDPATSTGICPYFDPDGPGPEPVKGSDFMTSGSLTINKLDDVGYDIIVHALTFSDGTTFDEFTMTG